MNRYFDRTACPAGSAVCFHLYAEQTPSIPNRYCCHDNFIITDLPYFEKVCFTVSSISSGLHWRLWRIFASRISSMACGIFTPEIRSISSIRANSSASSFFPRTASITLLENLYGLAVDAITVFVVSPVFALYCS